MFARLSVLLSNLCEKIVGGTCLFDEAHSASHDYFLSKVRNKLTLFNTSVELCF